MRGSSHAICQYFLTVRRVRSWNARRSTKKPGDQVHARTLNQIRLRRKFPRLAISAVQCNVAIANSQPISRKIRLPADQLISNSPAFAIMTLYPPFR